MKKFLFLYSPDLTWRDVQHIVVETSKIPSVDPKWIINGAGKHVSHTYGFGVLDCGAMVNAALNWQRVPELSIQKSQVYDVNRWVLFITVYYIYLDVHVCCQQVGVFR